MPAWGRKCHLFPDSGHSLWPRPSPRHETASGSNGRGVGGRGSSPVRRHFGADVRDLPTWRPGQPAGIETFVPEDCFHFVECLLAAVVSI